MLIVKDIKKKFIKTDKNNKKYEIYANNGISFKAKDHMIIGILGPNGAGKTTLLRSVAGIIEPTEGSVSYDDLNFKDNEIEIKKNIAFLSGNTKLYNTLSCYELLKMCLDIYKVDKSKQEERIKYISNKLNMDKFL
ncbi:MAG: ATP-binding cassette domain-containing protein, partial [Bacilli bacterium]|nr:ATP-binding cassette domain-containing protein [Bacilli bacterium]